MKSTLGARVRRLMFTPRSSCMVITQLRGVKKTLYLSINRYTLIPRPHRGREVISSSSEQIHNRWDLNLRPVMYRF